MTNTNPEKPFTITISSDPSIPKMLELYTGMISFPFSTKEDFLEVAAYHAPAAVFIDTDVGGKGRGLELIPLVTRTYPDMPIMMIGYANDHALLVQSFALGAEDFLTKPLMRAEVMARTFRRIAASQRLKRISRTLGFGDIWLKAEERLIHCEKKSTQLAALPFGLLAYLVESRGVVVERASLLAAGWRGTNVSNNALDQQIHLCRKALAEVGSKLSIKVAYGVGFQLSDEKIAS